MVKKVKNRLKGIRTFEQRVVSCPIDKNKLKKMFEKYGRFAPFFINQEGHRVVDMKDNPLIKLKDMDKF